MRPLYWVLATFLVVSACRGTRPEAGLPRAVFEEPAPRVVSNDRGLWFLVTDGTTPFTPFVSVQAGDEPEVFYAIPRGSRTVRLMPVTPHAYGSLDAVRGSTVEIEWLETPADAGDLAEPVGWWSGRPGEPVAWAGAAPADGSSVALVTSVAPAGLAPSDWIVGNATLKGGRLVDANLEEGTSGALVVLPDGHPPADDVSVAAAGVEVPQGRGYTVRPANIEQPPSALASRFTHRPLALQTAADLLVTPADADSAQITMSHPIVHRGLVLAVTEDPVTVPRAELPTAIGAFRALESGQFLAAVDALLEAQPRTDENAYSGRLRVLELLGAAGYVDWTRSSLISEADGLDADVALYLARAHLLAGDVARADDFAERAAQRFHLWTSPAAELGMGRAKRLRAIIAADQKNWATALALAVDAATLFSEADDPMRAAETELLASVYALRARDARRAVKAASLARSRYFHGHAPYYSALAEIALSDIYHRVGETAEAEKMARFALLRFEELQAPVGVNRARIAEGRIGRSKSRSQAIRELEIGLEKARANNDVVGVLDAAASLVVMGAATGPATASYGLAIVRGLDRADDPFVRARAHQALAMLCSKGLADAVGENDGAPIVVAGAKAACSSAQRQRSDDVMLTSLLTQGWAALGTDDLEEARDLADRARAAVDEQLRREAPRQAAEAVLFGAVVERQSGGSGWDTTAEEALELLRKSLDPTRLATIYRDMAEQYLARGEAWLAARLLRGAVAAAGEQGQAELRRGLAMRRVEVLHSSGDWDAARDAIRDAEPIIEGAGAGSAPQLAKLYALQADVLQRLGRKADATVASSKASEQLSETEPVDRVELTLLRARLAVDRGDLDGGQRGVTRADRLEKGLSDGLVDDRARRLLRARIEMLQGRLQAMRGDQAAAAKSYLAAADAIGALESTEDVIRVRLRALAGLGETATSDARVEDAVKQLEATRGLAAEKLPALLPAATEALATLEILAGRPSRAHELVESARVGGKAPATSALDALCLGARAAALSGNSDAVSALRRCAEKANGARAVDAALLAVLVDPSKTAADRNRKARSLSAEHGESLSTRQRERLALVSEFATGTTQAESRRDERLERKLRAAIDSGDAKRTVSAVTSYADYLIETGRSSRANDLVDTHSRAFYDASAESAGTLARLQTQALVRGLDPSAFNFVSRALSETPDLTPDDEAEMLLAAASNAIVLGMWQRARSHLADAADRAETARNRALQRRIDTVAERFEIPLSE